MSQRNRTRLLELELLEDRCVPSAAPVAYSSSDILVRFNPQPAVNYLGLSLLPGTTVSQAFDVLPGLYEVTLDPGVSVTQALAAYRADPRVLLATPDAEASASQLTGLPSPSSQLWGLQQIKAPQAWQVTTGNSKVIVAVMDTGIDYDQPDLYSNIWINQAEIPASRLKNLVDVYHDGYISWRDLNNPINQGPGKITDVNHDGRIDAADILAPMVLNAQGQDTGLGGWADGSTQDGSGYTDDLIGWNFVSTTNNPMDDNGHGTTVAGIIGATGADGSGVVGVDPNVQLMPIKWMGSNGVGTVGAYLQGLQFAISHGAKIINNSWTDTNAFDGSLLSYYIQSAQAQGVIFVAAAGNSHANNDTAPVYPADVGLANVVAVAATDQSDNLASFSDYGVKSVALGAPGVSIYSTMRNDTFGSASGTSEAAPFVTGVLALVLGQHPNWTYQQVIHQVLSTVDPVSGLAGKVTTGGRLDAAAAVGWTPAYAVAFQAPTVTNVSSVANTLSTLQVTFNKSINPATLTTSAVTVTGPNGAVKATSITQVAGSNNTQFLIALPTQTAYGTYIVKINTTVQDTVGYSLPANQNTFVLINPGPQVSSFTPLLAGTNTVFGILVTFNHPVNTSSFAPTNATLLGPNGAVIPIQLILASATANPTQFLIQFAMQTTPGTYTFKLSGVLDTAGNPMVPYQTQFSLTSGA